MMSRKIDDNQKGIIKEAVQHFVDAQLQDQELDIDEFVKKYPGLERQIRQSIQDVQKIDTLFASLVQADECDFEDAAAGLELVGEKIGSFEIVEMIGRGGMGVSIWPVTLSSSALLLSRVCRLNCRLTQLRGSVSAVRPKYWHR